MPTAAFRPIRLAFALPLFALAACGSEEVTVEPEGAPTDFIATSPTDTGVPVDLPETPMTNPPETEATTAP